MRIGERPYAHSAPSFRLNTIAGTEPRERSPKN